MTTNEKLDELHEALRLTILAMNSVSQSRVPGWMSIFELYKAAGTRIDREIGKLKEGRP